MRNRRPRHVSLIAHFWSLVDKRGPDECWEWIGGSWTGEPGRKYGLFSIGATTKELAHRFSLEMKVGPLGDQLALHKCDNPPCVNPSHLYAGDVQQNADDRSSRPRFSDVVSAKWHNRVLADFFKERNLSQSGFADLIGCSKSTVSHWLYRDKVRPPVALAARLMSVLGEERFNAAFQAVRGGTIPKATIDRIVEMKRAGATSRQIEKETGASQMFIWRVLKPLGLVRSYRSNQSVSV